MAKFYIVFSPQGTAPPVRQHSNHKAAKAIAHQMAKQHLGQQFFVMESASKPIIEEQQAEAA